MGQLWSFDGSIKSAFAGGCNSVLQGFYFQGGSWKYNSLFSEVEKGYHKYT